MSTTGGPNPQRRTSPQYAPQASRPVPMSNLSNETGERSYSESYYAGQRQEHMQTSTMRSPSAVRGGPGDGRGGPGGGSGGGSGGGGPDDGDDNPRGGLDLIVPGGGVSGGDPSDLINFLTSGWLNLTVITQPDMRSLLKHPALRNIIAAIACEAMEELMEQMRADMERKVWDKIETHLNPLARNTAAYVLVEPTHGDGSAADTLRKV
ncbi:hypothetical protein B0H14DRAFT_3488279 [Mycena olivaceomarginata]|nr:hypothetical protein B0H14DRAFT_3488279 [Mycena olivaceomarginata]